MAKLNDFLKGLGQGYILQPHLEKWFKQDFTGHPDVPFSIRVDKPEDDAFHPSSHAVGCARSIYAIFDPDVEHTQRKFNPKVGINGHMWHGLIQHIVVELGFAQSEDIEKKYDKYRGLDDQWFEPDAKTRMRWHATGSADIVNLVVPGYDEKFLVDIKTMNSIEFKKPTPSEFLWTKYVAQCQLYLDWADLETCIILGVEAGNPFAFKEIIIKRDPDHVEYIYNKWNSVAKALVDKVLPDHSCINPAECDTNTIYGNFEEASSPQEGISQVST